EDDIGNTGLAAVVSEKIAAARTAHALHEPALSQHGEKLLEVGQRNFLPFGDLGERNRVALAVLGEIDHCHNCVPAFGAQPHDPSSGGLCPPQSSSLPLPPELA